MRIFARAGAALLTTAALTVLPMAHAQAQQWGRWHIDVSGAGHTVACLVISRSSDQDLVFTARVSNQPPGEFQVGMHTPNDSGRTASGAVIFEFDDGAVIRTVGQTSSGGFDVVFKGGALAPWLHEFTVRRSMTVLFDDKSHVLNLNGTTDAVSALAKCVEENGISGLPKPFANPTRPTYGPVLGVSQHADSSGAPGVGADVSGPVTALVVVGVIFGPILGCGIARLRRQNARLEAGVREHARLMGKYGDAQVVDQIRRGLVWQGMTADMLRDSLGAPLAIDTKVDHSKRTDILTYGPGTRIALENGLVVGWQTKTGLAPAASHHYQSLGELAVRTATRAVVWEITDKLFRKL